MPEDGRLLIPGARPRFAAALVGIVAFGISAGVRLDAAPAGAVTVRNAAAAPLEPGPVWVSKAAWDVSEEHLVIADPGSGRIYVYDTAGRIQRRIANPGLGALEFTTPNYAVRIGDRYAIAASPLRWVWFDRNLAAQSAWELDWEEGAGPHSRMDVSEFDFTDTHLYAIGNVMSFDGTWSDKGVFRIALADRKVQQLRRFPKDDAEKSHYNEPPFNLCVCGGKAWLLQMTASVSIVEARDGGKRLQSFPEELRRRPALPALSDSNSLRARHAALRNSAAADGLFCAGDRDLLLLAHEPRPQGGVQWLVYTIDPVRDTMSAPIALPTGAGEIVFVPGRTRWAVLEKGAMKYPGVQPLTRILSFPRPAPGALKGSTAP